MLNANGQPIYQQQYTSGPQSAPGTTLFSGFASSVISSADGTFTSVGNNFLSSLDFGGAPTMSKTPPSQLTTVMSNNGDWLPGPTGSKASQGDGALTLHTTAGPAGPDTASGNHVAISEAAGTISTNNATIPVTNGAFSPSAVAITGSLRLAVNSYFGNALGGQLGATSAPQIFGMMFGQSKTANQRHIGWDNHQRNRREFLSVHFDHPSPGDRWPPPEWHVFEGAACLLVPRRGESGGW